MINDFQPITIISIFLVVNLIRNTCTASGPSGLILQVINKNSLDVPPVDTTGIHPITNVGGVTLVTDSIMGNVFQLSGSNSLSISIGTPVTATRTFWVSTSYQTSSSGNVMSSLKWAVLFDGTQYLRSTPNWPHTPFIIDSTLRGDGWVFYAVTISASTTELYVNGVLVQSVAITPWSGDSGPLGIGNYPDGGSWYYKGLLDDFRMYNRVLTAAEIYSIFTSAHMTFQYIGSYQTFTVPAGVTLLTVDAYGAQGGVGNFNQDSLGGLGGHIQSKVTVTPGDILYVYVGAKGGSYGAVGGYNGGGSGGSSCCGGIGGGAGGDATDIRTMIGQLASRLVVAGGGGGGGAGSGTAIGGVGGGLIGGYDASFQVPGGSQSAGGTGLCSNGCGTDGALGVGGICYFNSNGGGGGGGYYGGGGAGGPGGGDCGGGGGSSYSIGTIISNDQGVRSGDGLLVLSYFTASPTVTPTSAPTQTPSSIPSIRPSVPSATPTTSPTTSCYLGYHEKLFDSTISFSSTKIRTPIEVTVTFRSKCDMLPGQVININMPRFTIGSLNSTVGKNIALGNLFITPSLPFRAGWLEGNYSKMFSDSILQIMIAPDHIIKAGDTINIIILLENGLMVICGFPAYDTTNSIVGGLVKFEIYTNISSYSTSNKDYIPHPQMGPGCTDSKWCHNQGLCDYCLQICQCNDGFGSVSDVVKYGIKDMDGTCHQRTCPIGPAIADIPKSPTSAHSSQECSGRGLCDRARGTCSCFPPFVGSACDRMQCPNDCSGHGQCLSMRELAKASGALPLAKKVYSYGEQSLLGSTWDANIIHGCVCDSSWPVGFEAFQRQLPEWFGADCSLRRCPSGKNPFTSENETDCFHVNQIDRGHTALFGAVKNICHIDCSGRGKCDYKTGVCKCFSGSWGDACDKLSRPYR